MKWVESIFWQNCSSQEVLLVALKLQRLQGQLPQFQEHIRLVPDLLHQLPCLQNRKGICSHKSTVVQLKCFQLRIICPYLLQLFVEKQLPNQTIHLL